MNIIMHTDGSKKENVGSATSIIFGNENFYITSIHRTYKVRCNQDSEFWGVIQGLNWIKDYNIDFDSITCYTDSKEVAETYKNYNKNPTSFLAGKLQFLLKELGVHRIRIHRVKGHAAIMNINSVCDLQAKAIRVNYESNRKLASLPLL